MAKKSRRYSSFEDAEMAEDADYIESAVDIKSVVNIEPAVDIELDGDIYLAEDIDSIAAVVLGRVERMEYARNMTDMKALRLLRFIVNDLNSSEFTKEELSESFDAFTYVVDEDIRARSINYGKVHLNRLLDRGFVEAIDDEYYMVTPQGHQMVEGAEEAEEAEEL